MQWPRAISRPEAPTHWPLSANTCSLIEVDGLSLPSLDERLTTTTHAFPAALEAEAVRNASGLRREAFSDVSSCTHMSSLERGLKSPTLNKLNDPWKVMDVQQERAHGGRQGGKRQRWCGPHPSPRACSEGTAAN